MKSLLDAVRAGDIDGVRANLSADSSCAAVKDENGVSAVLLATYYGQPLIANLLIERRNDLDVFEGRRPRSSGAGRTERASVFAEITGTNKAHSFICLRIDASHASPPRSSFRSNHTWSPAARSASQMRWTASASCDA